MPAARDGFLQPSGPTSLDEKCKESLQQVLKPSNYSVIVPWLKSAGPEAKRDMINLARHASGADTEFQDPVKMYAALREQTLLNSNGRPKLAKAAHVSADRVQSDLLRNRCRSDQRDVALHDQRRFFANFHSVPSRDSVADSHRLAETSVASDATTQVLTEHARRKLHQWQVRGPEQDRQASAQVMRSLRSLSSAVERLPRYSDHAALQPPGGQGCRDSLHEYSKVVPRGHRTLKAPAMPLHHCSSAPATLRPFIDPDEVAGIQSPGGYLVNHSDSSPLQMMKNKERAIKSKIPIAGGRRDWSTSSKAIGVGQGV